MAEGGEVDQLKESQIKLTSKVERQAKIESSIVMDLGNAGILRFAPIGGLDLVNKRQRARRDGLVTEYPSRSINQANKAEVDWHRDKKTGADPLSQDFEYKVALLDLAFDGGIATYDTKPSTFVMTNDDARIGLSLAEGLKLRAELGIPLATAMVIFTTEEDGSEMMIVQNRSVKNATYKQMLGAPVAGTNEHTINRKTGALNPLNTAEVRAFAREEMSEEIGILPEYIVGGVDEGMIITGMAIDKLRVHLEVLVMAKVNMSAKDLARKAQENMLVMRKVFDFSENILVIPGDPESIRKTVLLKTPIPPTHTATLVAAGRMKVLMRDGAVAAEHWVKTLEKEIIENTKDIDRIVREATNGVEKGYNPRKTPEEQGLLPAEVALHDAGLLAPLI